MYKPFKKFFSSSHHLRKTESCDSLNKQVTYLYVKESPAQSSKIRSEIKHRKSRRTEPTSKSFGSYGPEAYFIPPDDLKTHHEKAIIDKAKKKKKHREEKPKKHERSEDITAKLLKEHKRKAEPKLVDQQWVTKKEIINLVSKHESSNSSLKKFFYFDHQKNERTDTESKIRKHHHQHSADSKKRLEEPPPKHKKHREESARKEKHREKDDRKVKPKKKLRKDMFMIVNILPEDSCVEKKKKTEAYKKYYHDLAHSTVSDSHKACEDPSDLSLPKNIKTRHFNLETHVEAIEPQEKKKGIIGIYHSKIPICNTNMIECSKNIEVLVSDDEDALKEATSVRESKEDLKKESSKVKSTPSSASKTSKIKSKSFVVKEEEKMKKKRSATSDKELKSQGNSPIKMQGQDASNDPKSRSCTPSSQDSKPALETNKSSLGVLKCKITKKSEDEPSSKNLKKKLENRQSVVKTDSSKSKRSAGLKSKKRGSTQSTATDMLIKSDYSSNHQTEAKKNVLKSAVNESNKPRQSKLPLWKKPAKKIEKGGHTISNSTFRSKSDTKIVESKKKFERSSSRGSFCHSNSVSVTDKSEHQNPTFLLTKTYRDDDKWDRWQKRKNYSDMVRRSLNKKQNVVPQQVFEVRHLKVDSSKSTTDLCSDDLLEPEPKCLSEDLPQRAASVPLEFGDDIFELDIDKAIDDIMNENEDFLKKDFSLALAKVTTADESDSDDKKEWFEFSTNGSEILYSESLSLCSHQHEIVNFQNEIIADFRFSPPSSEESGYATVKSEKTATFFEKPEIKALMQLPPGPPLSDVQTETFFDPECKSQQTVLNTSQKSLQIKISDVGGGDSQTSKISVKLRTGWLYKKIGKIFCRKKRSIINHKEQ